jgi:putative transposase
MSGEHKVELLCEALMVSRSGYYDWVHRRSVPGKRAQENAILRQRIRESFEGSRRTYGSPRIAHDLGCPGGRNRIARLMRRDHIQARQRSKYRVVTTDSSHAYPVAPNRLKGAKATRRNQIWVTDVTHILTAQGWLYLTGVLDLHSRKVIGWSMGTVLDAKLVVAALQMAINQRRPTEPLIVHSDRGRPFASNAFCALLAAHRFLASMSRKGNCYDNAFIESFWSSLKAELMPRQRFATNAQARSAIFEYIEGFYNKRRLHSSLGYKSPLDFESQLN